MRKSDKVFPFCNLLANYWCIYFPDLRFGQMMLNFFAWHNTIYGSDVFYLEEDEFMVRFEKWVAECAPKNK